MGRNNSASSGVISKRENILPKRRGDLNERDKPKPGDLIKDPVRCPLCLGTVMCPRNKDYDDFMDQKILRCLTSKDPICARAVAAKGNAEYIKSVQLRVKNHASTN